MEWIVKCYDYIAVLAVTLLSMINENRPALKWDWHVFALFLQNLTYVALVTYGLIYVGIPHELSLVIAYAVGRWSYLLDTKVKEFLSSVSIIGIWKEFTSWKK